MVVSCLIIAVDISVDLSPSSTYVHFVSEICFDMNTNTQKGRSCGLRTYFSLDGVKLR